MYEVREGNTVSSSSNSSSSQGMERFMEQVSQVFLPTRTQCSDGIKVGSVSLSVFWQVIIRFGTHDLEAPWGN